VEPRDMQILYEQVSYVRFEVFTAMKVQVLFWVETPCSGVRGYHMKMKMEAARSSERLVS